MALPDGITNENESDDEAEPAYKQGLPYATAHAMGQATVKRRKAAAKAVMEAEARSARSSATSIGVPRGAKCEKRADGRRRRGRRHRPNEKQAAMVVLLVVVAVVVRSKRAQANRLPEDS